MRRKVFPLMTDSEKNFPFTVTPLQAKFVDFVSCSPTKNKLLKGKSAEDHPHTLILTPRRKRRNRRQEAFLANTAGNEFRFHSAKHREACVLFLFCEQHQGKHISAIVGITTCAAQNIVYEGHILSLFESVIYGYAARGM